MKLRSRVLWVSLAVLLTSMLLAFREMDRLVGQVPLGNGFSILEVTGPTALLNRSDWGLGSSDGLEWRVEPFVRTYLVLDAIFIAIYGTAAYLIARHLVADPGRRRYANIALAGLVTMDLAEDVLLCVTAATASLRISQRGAQWYEDLDRLALIQSVSSTAKWLLLAALVVMVFRGTDAVSDRLLKRVARTLRAGFVQRGIVLLVLVLTVVSIFPMHPILEQVPDVERSWLDQGMGAQGGIAATALVVLAIIFWFLGQATALRVGEPRKEAAGINYLIWAAIPTVLLISAVVVSEQARASGVRLLDLGTFNVLFSVILAVLFACAAMAGWRRYRASRVNAGDFAAVPFDSGGAQFNRQDSQRAGSVLSALIVAIPAIGFIRSLSTQMILLASAPKEMEDGPILAVPEVDLVQSFSLIACMLILSISSLVFATGRPGITDPFPVHPTRRSVVLASSGTMLACILVLTLALMTAWPTTMGTALGPVAVMAGALGSWLGLATLFALVLSYRASLPLFNNRFVSLRGDPVLMILIFIPLFVGQFSPPGLHGIRTSSSPDLLYQRPSLSTAFVEWIQRNDACTVKIEDARGVEHHIRPMLLVAAEGGGIRAAAWTIAGMSELVAAGGCPSSSVFLSSGVSGGAVGLSVAANPPWNPGDLVGADNETTGRMAGELRESIRKIANSGALAAAIQGLAVRDPIAEATGIRVPANPSLQWEDRASLIERSWAVAYPALSAFFDRDAGAPTGLVVLNSTDVLSGCRVVVSQLELGVGDSGDTSNVVAEHSGGSIASCARGTAEPALTVDLLDFFERCQGPNSRAGLTWATAALLSARFPVVTPSGVIGVSSECPAPRLQLVDGGYAENTGLGLLADTAPAIGALVRQYNTVAAASGRALVVPYVMFMQSSPDPITKAKGITIGQTLVPFAGLDAKKNQVSPSSWIQRIMASLGPLCNTPAPRLVKPKDIRCDSIAGAIAWNVDPARRVIEMKPESQPAIAVPLGWELSESSVSQIIRNAHTEATSTASKSFDSDSHRLGDFLQLFKG